MLFDEWPANVYLTPGGGIPARSGATLGSATCTLLSVAGGIRAITASSRTLHNVSLTSIAANTDVIAVDCDGTLIAIPSSQEELVVVRYTLSSPLAGTVGATASATASNSWGAVVTGSITVTNTSTAAGLAGSTGIAVFTGTAWAVVVQQQIAQRVTGTASADFDETTSSVTLNSPQSLSLWPHNFINGATIPAINAQKHNALSGDTCIAHYNSAEGEYRIQQVDPALAKRFFFELIDDWPLGLTQLGDSTIVSPTRVAPGYRGALPTSTQIQVRDRYDRAHNAGPEVSAFVADTGVCEYNHETSEWDIIEITHRATRCLGTVYANFSSTPATFTVDVAQTGLLDGRHPNAINTGSGQITVQNRYSWEEGSAGLEIEIARDPHTGNWYPIQMECP